jgi:hypothetical protein
MKDNIINWIDLKEKPIPRDIRVLIYGTVIADPDTEMEYTAHIWEAELCPKLKYDTWIKAYKITHWAEYPNLP